MKRLVFAIIMIGCAVINMFSFMNWYNKENITLTIVSALAFVLCIISGTLHLVKLLDGQK